MISLEQIDDMRPEEFTLDFIEKLHKQILVDAKRPERKLPSSVYHENKKQYGACYYDPSNENVENIVNFEFSAKVPCLIGQLIKNDALRITLDNYVEEVAKQYFQNIPLNIINYLMAVQSAHDMNAYLSDFQAQMVEFLEKLDISKYVFVE